MFDNEQLAYELKLLQKEIYKATMYNDYRHVHKIQKRLLGLQSIKVLILFRIVNNYSKYWLNTVNYDTRQLLCKKKVYQYTSASDKKQVYKRSNQLLNKQRYKIFVQQAIIKNLSYVIKSNLIYLCLKSEWEAKLTSNSFVNKIQYHYIDGINTILNFCLQYYKLKYKKIYILKNKIDVLYKLHTLNYKYLEEKLDTLPCVNKFIQAYLALCSTSSIKKCYSAIFRVQTEKCNPALFHLLSLLKKIIIENLSTEINFKKDMYIETKHKNDVISNLSRFLWQDNSFVFFSISKNEAVFVQSYIIQFFNNIGMQLNTRNIPIIELKHGFNFLDCYITLQNNHVQKTLNNNIAIQPSVKSQLMFLKKIKNILYHRNSLSHRRANTYLSSRSAIAKIKYTVKQWKKYYSQLEFVNNVVHQRLYLVIDNMFQRWQSKKNYKLKIKKVCQLYSHLKVKNLLFSENFY